MRYQSRRRRSGRTASAGPLFWTNLLSVVSLFSRFGSFFFVLTSDFQFIDAIINNRSLRVSSIDQPSQGVKTLKNNAITLYYNDSYHTYGPCREKT